MDLDMRKPDVDVCEQQRCRPASTFVQSGQQARGRSFALNGTQGEVGVSLKKKFLGRLIHTNASCGDILPLHHFSPSINWL